MTRCDCAGSTTFLLGSAANADAQNANVSTTLAHRTDEPHRRLNLFSIRMPYRDSVSDFAQAYLEAIQDKETTLSALQINPSKKYSGRSGRRFFATGHRLPAWLCRQIEPGAARHDERIRPITRTGLTSVDQIWVGPHS
jgi:hypothetical protein